MNNYFEKLAEFAGKTGLDIESSIQRINSVIGESGNEKYCEEMERAIYFLESACTCLESAAKGETSALSKPYAWALEDASGLVSLLLTKPNKSSWVWRNSVIKELFTVAPVVQQQSNVKFLVMSEIGDFFSAFGHPSEPATPEEMQRQLMDRVAVCFGESE
ncbi:hypothetical protein [Hafnia paralvei]|uniref:hypothetical protein n=1 Tax=Hafnia paralvei TaxID=546367 RepID=UPI003C3E5D3D